MAAEGDGAAATYWPGLDGLRGIAVLLVVGCHLGIPGFLVMSGPLGVTMFFTLSGYLITSGLCRDRARAGRVNLASFYVRRARRLLPALYCLIAVLVVASPMFGLGLVTPVEVVGAALYCSNLLMAFGMTPSGGGALHHTWSLVLEEQFYALWPAVLLLLWSRRRLLVVLLGAAVLGSVGYRAWLWDVHGGAGIEFGTLSRADELLVGCVFALVLHGRTARPTTRWTGPTALLICLLLQVTPLAFTMVAGFSIAAVATGALISGEVGGGGAILLRWRPLRAVGRVSYGLYLWHPVVLMVVRHTVDPQGWLERTLWVLPGSAVLTLLSWHFVERRFLRGRTAGPQTAASTKSSLDADKQTALRHRESAEERQRRGIVIGPCDPALVRGAPAGSSDEGREPLGVAAMTTHEEVFANTTRPQ